MKTALCTISSNNFLPYGLNCLMSVKKFNDYDLFYLIADEYNQRLYDIYSKDITFVSMEKIGIDSVILDKLKFKYNIVEFNTSIKPAFYLYLFSLGYDNVIYFDPDIECYWKLTALENDLKNHSIVVTPHKLVPVESELLTDNAILNNGIYNLGFIAVKKDDNSTAFLKWWHERLMDRCYVDYKVGLATDQIWVELASTLFDGFYVTKNSGMNVAFWNFNERKLIYKDNQYFINENTPLLFFHFSSLSVNCKKSLYDTLNNVNSYFESFYKKHIDDVLTYNFEAFSKIKYKYLTYSNGEKILPEERLFYGYAVRVNQKFNDPFSTSKDSYYTFIHKKGHNTKIFPIEEKKYRILIKIFGIRFFIKLAYKVKKITINNFAKLYS